MSKSLLFLVHRIGSWRCLLTWHWCRRWRSTSKSRSDIGIARCRRRRRWKRSRSQSLRRKRRRKKALRNQHRKLQPSRISQLVSLPDLPRLLLHQQALRQQRHRQRKRHAPIFHPTSCAHLLHHHTSRDHQHPRPHPNASAPLPFPQNCTFPFPNRPVSFRSPTNTSAAVLHPCLLLHLLMAASAGPVTMRRLLRSRWRGSGRTGMARKIPRCQRLCIGFRFFRTSTLYPLRFRGSFELAWN